MKADIVIFCNSGHSVYVIYWFMPKMIPNNDIMMTCTIYPNDSHVNQLENSSWKIIYGRLNLLKIQYREKSKPNELVMSKIAKFEIE